VYRSFFFYFIRCMGVLKICGMRLSGADDGWHGEISLEGEDKDRVVYDANVGPH
jgi:hypothetical protein